MQGSPVADAAGQICPAVQLSQAVCPPSGCIVPDGHESHVAFATTEKLPG